MNSRTPLSRRRVRRRLACAALGLLAAAAVLALVQWRRTDGAPIRAARGELAGAVVLGSRPTGLGSVELLAFHNQGGEVARAYYRRPRELPPDYRLVVMYAGLGTGEKILDLLPERSDRPLLALQYPYAKPRTLAGRLSWVADVRRAAARTVAGGMLGLTFLESTQGLDLSRAVIVGSSLGSIFAALHGALDERVPKVVLVHGGGDFHELARRHIACWWQRPLALALASGPFYGFDPVHYIGRIAPRELIMIAASDDERFPTSSTLALFARAGDPKRLLWTESPHVRSRNTALVDTLVAQIEAAVASGSREPALRTALPRPQP